MKKKFISAIVPAFNEEKNISEVLKILTQNNDINEIIVVNDGSTDKTLEVIKTFKRIRLFNFVKNHGKSFAIVKGVERSNGEIIIFIDADLSGLYNSHIEKLIKPLILGKKDVVIGYPNEKKDKIFYPISGERAYFKKDLVPYLKKMLKKGYGLELYLNYIFRNKKIKLFPLDGVRSPSKYEKQTYDTYAKLFMVECFDILYEVLKQKNPVSYLMKSYLYSFYIKKPKRNNNQINKLIKYIKNNLIDKIYL
jgi:glycosyltransferase involved in cell wall biosynthesis